MKDLYLIIKNLTRNKLRLILNAFAIFTAFFLFGLIGAVKSAFDAGVELSADNRLITVNKINFTQPLPLAYFNKIKSIEGIEHVSHANWFGAYHQDQRKPLVGFAVDPESYLQVYSELQLDEASKQRWMNERQGVIVGEALAKTKAWKVGDRVPISSSIFSQADGSSVWDMVISGIFSAQDKQTDTNYLMFHYKYFIETQTFGRDWIGWLAITTDDPKLNQQVAEDIDTLFANSSAETETTSEKAFNKAFIEQLGSIGLILTSVVLAAFFTILLIVGNAMALAVRERTKEIAVLKTLGFPSPRIFRMILSESMFLSLIGGVFGFGLAYIVLGGMSNVPQVRAILPNLMITPELALAALGYMLALGFVTGFFPALRAMKLNTIDALSRG